MVSKIFLSTVKHEKNSGGFMRRLRLLAVILFVFGLALITILFYEEFTNNLNYYYNTGILSD